MTTQLAPHRTDLPPPSTSPLSDGGRVVGWVGDETIGFGGFANEDEAMSAAWMAHRTLSQHRARRDGMRPIPIDVEPLSLARDGRRDTILASGRTIATLVRPGDDAPSGPDAFGFELRVPVRRDQARTRAKAFLIYRTLRRSGIRWALWHADDRAAARPVRADDGASDAIARTDAAESRAGDEERGARGFWRRFGGALALPAIVAVAVFLPALTTSFVVSVLGIAAAIVAAAALGALARLVVTDLRSDARQAIAHRRGAALAPYIGPQLDAYHRARSGR